ncbi:pre-rRNA-processing protein TSR2 homolog [Ciconia boyciana]|uniref:pre-rRNA-processing protein TSR2 homolog n=1 Tax=Ciconia boyciana TaxID=52775 RepID=UPI003B9E05CA
MAAPGLDERALFARGVRAVLGGWAALQLAVAQGFGGPQGPEKAAWLAGALQDFFTQNAELGEEEVEEFLAEVMDNEFDTAVEDGSLREFPQVSRQLLSLSARARRGDAGGVGEALGALARRGPALRAALAAARAGEGPAPWEEEEEEPRLTTPRDPALPDHAPRRWGRPPPRDPPQPEGGGEEEEEAMECGTPAPRRLDPGAAAAALRGAGPRGDTPPAPPPPRARPAPTAQGAGTNKGSAPAPMGGVERERESGVGGL